MSEPLVVAGKMSYFTVYSKSAQEAVDSAKKEIARRNIDPLRWDSFQKGDGGWEITVTWNKVPLWSSDFDPYE